MSNNNNLIPIPGRMHCVATEGVGLGADEIFDDAKGKRQSMINQETDVALDNKYDKDETYSKQELNNLITTPNQYYVTVPTYGSLPATGEADTVYRVSNYDGEQSQVDATKYSEYAWDGIQYVFLCVKTQIGEVFDITAYNSNTKYADLTAALGTDGANVPQELRRGGMSVKYVQTSDNKYVQYRYMSSSTAVADFTNVANWQGVDDVPAVGSHNLVESKGVADEFIPIYGIGKHSNVSFVANEWLDGSNKIVYSDNATFYRIKVEDRSYFSIKRTSPSNAFYCMVLNGYEESHSLPYTPTFATGFEGRIVNDFEGNLPNDATDIIVAAHNNVTGANCLPGTLIIGKIDYLKGMLQQLMDNKVENSDINGFKSLSNFRGKKISIIGDSISTFDKEGYKIDGYRMYYPYGDITAVNQTYWKKLIDLCGGEIEVNASWSGSRVTNTRSGEGYPDFYDRVGLLGNPDVIIVELGQNDAGAGSSAIHYGKYEYDAEIVNLSEAEFIPAYIKGIKGLKANYPNAEIWCIITNYPSGNHADRIKTAIKNIADHYTLPCVDVSGYDDTGMSANHPSAYGMQFIVNKIAGYIDDRALVDSIKALDEQSSVKQNVITFEQGGISGGSEVANEYRIRSGYIDIESFISAKVLDDYVLWAVLYDKDKHYLSATSASKTSVSIKEITNANVRYIRFLIANSTNGIVPTVDNSIVIRPTDETGFVLYYDHIVGYINSKNQELVDKKIRDNVRFDLLDIASVDNYYTKEDGDAIYSPSWTRYVIKGDAIINIAFKVFSSLDPTSFPYKAISFYNSTTLRASTLISGIGFGDYTSGTMSQDVSVPANCKAIAICTRNNDTPTDGVVISGFIDAAKVKAIMDNLKDDVTELANSELDIKYDSVGNAEFWLDSITSAFSDMVWVGDRLIGFTSSSDDLQTTTGTIDIAEYANGADKPRTNRYTLQHYFGHCNTVDYKAETDCLILGNGSGDYALEGKIIVIPNFSQIVGVSASSLTPLSLSDVNALVIDCSSYNLGGKFNLVWGDDNDKNYNIAYLITANIDGTTSANGGDLEHIRKIVLRKGSEVGAYGSIVENNTPFNGTFDIVETSHQVTEGYPNCDQGTCYYNGEIYACIGHDGLWYWRMRLTNRKVFKKDYKQQTYYANKPQNYGNATGICIKDGYLFIGRASIGVMAIRL